MNWNHIVTVYIKELKDSLRDRRTLISMIVVPALVMPVIMIGVGLIMSKIVRQAKQETPSVMIVGGEDSPAVVAALKAEKNAAAYVSPLPPGFLATMAKLIDERTPFFAKLKELTVVGYFSSELGVTEFLEYNPMPMRYDGDFDFAKVGTHWSH